MTNCCKNKTRFKSFVKQIQGNNLIPRPGFGIKLLVDLFIMALDIWVVFLQYAAIQLHLVSYVKHKTIYCCFKKKQLSSNIKVGVNGINLGLMDIISVTK